MNELTKKKKIVAAITAFILSAILSIAAGWALGVTWDIACDAIDCEIDAHGRSAFGDRYEPKEIVQ